MFVNGQAVHIRSLFNNRDALEVALRLESEVGMVAAYIASMDRAINTDLQRKRALLKWVAALLALLAVAWWLPSLLRASTEKTNLRLASVTEGTIQSLISATGTLVPETEKSLVSPTATRITEVLADPGQEVNKGDLLLVLDTTETQAELDRLGEEIALNKTQLRSKLLELQESATDKASTIELLEIDLRSRETRVARLRKLSENGGVSEDELLEAELNVQRTEVEIRQTRAALETLKLRRVAEEERLNLELNILLSRRQTQMRLVSTSEIRSPIDGVVTWLKPDAGAAVAQGELLARVAQTDGYAAQASVSDFYAPELKPGMKVNVTSTSGELTGTLARILPVPNASTLLLYVDLDNPQAGWLRANLRVDLGVVTAQRTGTRLLRRGAGVSGGVQQQLFRVEGSVATRVPVEIGLSNEREVEILTGLEPGDQVVISDTAAFDHRTQFEIH